MMIRSEQKHCSELPELENALLWCMRAWVIGHCYHRKASDRIETVFAKLGAAEAADDLDALMWTLSNGARRTIEVNCVCYPEISADERMLLDALALQQREDHDDAFATLTHLMNERAAIVACHCTQRVALALAAAGRILSAPQRDFGLGAGAYADVAWSGYLH